MKIILTGMRGSGKTTIARLLGKKLHWKMIDTDALIAKTVRMPLADYITKKGWPAFRAAEKKVIKKIATHDKIVIATGGGALMDAKNAALLKKRSMIILLTAPIATLKKRVASEGVRRPSLTGENPLQELGKVWKKREKTYTKIADHTIATQQKPEKIVEKIMAYVRVEEAH